MHVAKRELDGCIVAVVEVTPSDNPPVKYRGRVCVRIGPRRGFATPEEERRLTEKRRWGNLPFDQQPIAGTSIGDLDLLRFQEEYLPAVVPPDVLEENGRDLTDQLRALRLVAPNGQATAAGLLIFHRTYEGTAAPVRFTWYSDRVEITSPGGPYGMVTVQSFGAEGLTDYRNPTVGEAAKAMGFIQRFGSGIPRARAALARNGNPLPEFRAEPTYVHVTIRAAS